MAISRRRLRTVVRATQIHEGIAAVAVTCRAALVRVVLPAPTHTVADTARVIR